MLQATECNELLKPCEIKLHAHTVLSIQLLPVEDQAPLGGGGMPSLPS